MVRFSNGSIFEWSVPWSLAMEPTIRKPNFSKWPLQPRPFYINIIFIFVYKTIQAKAAILKSSDLGWSGLFENQTFQNGRFSQDRFIYKNKNNGFIKWSRLASVWFLNGWDQNQTTMDHPNFERIRNSSPHCNYIPIVNYSDDLNTGQK